MLVRDTIRTRLTDLFHPFSLDFENTINIDICLAEARKLGMTAFMAVLRTWVNSWATSHGSHDPTILPCLFGCLGGKDSLQHYIHCPHLFALMRYHNGSVSEDPLSRLGLVKPIWILSIFFAAPSLAIIVLAGALGSLALATWNHSPPVPFGITGQFLIQPSRLMQGSVALPV